MKVNFSAILPSDTTLGSIIARGFRDGHVEVLVGGPQGAKIASNPATINDAQTTTATANLNAQVMNFVHVQGQGSIIDKVSTSLDNGNIETAIASKIFVPFAQLSENDKGIIRSEQVSVDKVKSFELITMLYRGDLTIAVTHKADVSADVKANALSILSLGVGGSVDTDRENTVMVSGGVWLLTAMPYVVPPAPPT
jgi:hypothetical protein